MKQKPVSFSPKQLDHADHAIGKLIHKFLIPHSWMSQKLADSAVDLPLGKQNQHIKKAVTVTKRVLFVSDIFPQHLFSKGNPSMNN